MAHWNYHNPFFSALNELSKVTDKDQKQKLAEKIVSSLTNEYTHDHNFFIDRVNEIESDISVVNVPKPLMDALKEAIFCYVNGQYLSTIATIGIISDLFIFHLFKIFLEDNGIDKISTKRRLDEFNQVSQFEKIQILFSIAGVSEDICYALHEIRKIRNNAIHATTEKDYHPESLACLHMLIMVLDKYSNAMIEREKQLLEESSEEKK